MIAERYERKAPLQHPSMLIQRFADNSLGVDFDMNEWSDFSEAIDLAAWLDPLIVTFCEHDEIALAAGLPVVSLRKIGDELASCAKIFVDARELRSVKRKWRFTGGRPTTPPPPNSWGQYGRRRA